MSGTVTENKAPIQEMRFCEECEKLKSIIKDLEREYHQYRLEMPEASVAEERNLWKERLTLLEQEKERLTMAT